MAATNLLARLLEATEMCGRLSERVFNTEEKYREAAWKLNEAQDRIGHLEARIKDLEREKSSTPVQAIPEATTPAPADWVMVKCTPKNDKKMDMIKSVRNITNLGLKEAKDFVEGTPTRITRDALNKMEGRLFQISLPSAFTVVE